MVPSESSVLDIGCGVGVLSAALLEKRCAVRSQDVSRELLDLCERYLARKGLRGMILQGGVTEIVPEGQFDRVVALDVLEHIEDDRAALIKLRGCLKKDGLLILAIPALSCLYGPKDEQIGHYRRYDRDHLIGLLEESGFQIERVRYWNAIGVIPVWITSRVTGKRLNEDFRYQRRSIVQKTLNSGLRLWFTSIENRVRFPLGLTLIVTASPK
jgi:SAM-dependent methyltransferase